MLCEFDKQYSNLLVSVLKRLKLAAVVLDVLFYLG
jgi:hypothetical protein